jgi:hypothetical protein
MPAGPVAVPLVPIWGLRRQSVALSQKETRRIEAGPVAMGSKAGMFPGKKEKGVHLKSFSAESILVLAHEMIESRDGRSGVFPTA